MNNYYENEDQERRELPYSHVHITIIPYTIVDLLLVVSEIQTESQITDA